MILVLQVTAETTHYLSLIIRDGAEVTLPCENINGHHNCDRTSWSFNQQGTRSAVDLVKDGQFIEHTNKKADRLQVTSNCSLVIKNATTEDVGRYFCIQEENTEEQAVVDVSVVTMTEEKLSDSVRLKCSLLTKNTCGHTLEWLFAGRAVDEDHRDLNEQNLRCAVVLTLRTSHFIYTSKKYELLTCKIKEINGNRSVNFTLNHQLSDSERSETPSGNSETPTTEQPVPWWLYVVVPLGLVALLITAVVLIRQRRNKRKRNQTDENVVEAEGGVSYASISHTKNTDSTAKIRGGDDAVTYSMVKSSSAADHSSLYATIN